MFLGDGCVEYRSLESDGWRKFAKESNAPNWSLRGKGGCPEPRTDCLATSAAIEGTGQRAAASRIASRPLRDAPVGDDMDLAYRTWLSGRYGSARKEARIVSHRGPETSRDDARTPDPPPRQKKVA